MKCRSEMFCLGKKGKRKFEVVIVKNTFQICPSNVKKIVHILSQNAYRLGSTHLIFFIALKWISAAHSSIMWKRFFVCFLYFYMATWKCGV